MVALDRAVTSRLKDRETRLSSLSMEFCSHMAGLPMTAALRIALRQRSIRTGPHATPLSPSTAALADEFLRWFKDWLPGVLRECGNA
jgi:hypothetical protein